MLLGRSSLLPSIRYLSELSNKQYSLSGRKIRSSVDDFSSVITGSQLFRSSYNFEIYLTTSFARTMASSTKKYAKNIADTLLKKGQNRLALEKSPYLLQHARNPVQWYPWGDEALEKAKAEDKAISGHGGWPMSVFLAPNLTPIVGGTYFPPKDKHGLPGFQTVLLTISEEWRENKSELMLLGGTTIQKLRNLAENNGEPIVSERKTMGIQSSRLESALASTHCTFFLNRNDLYLRRNMGFARYSVDEEWHVPHFEKMLYDQAQLLQSYTEAFLTTKDPFFAEIIDDIATYVTRDLRHKEGGFYSAEDADSYPTETSTEKKEGAFYVWTYDEINTHLAQEVADKKGLKLSEVFCFHFTVKPKGNVSPRRDPHGELNKQNVLIVYGSVEDTAKHFGLTVEKTQALLKEASRILFEVREKRPRPHLDDKIIAAWNGLMISGLARAGSATGNKRYVDLATDAAKFIERYLYDKSERLLLRSCYRSDNGAIVLTSVPIRGYHADYAYVVKGLLDLYEANLDPYWLEFAETLQDIQDELFWDNTNGGYYSTTKDDPTIILRLKDDHDGAEPCSNSIACGNLLRLMTYLERFEFKDKAERLLTSFHKPLRLSASALTEMIKVLLHYHDSSTEIYIIGHSGAEDTNELLQVVRERLIPGQVLMFADPNKPDNILLRKNKVLAKVNEDKSVPRAYVCRYRACSLPVTTPAELADLLSTER
ncbi:hypothetical protein M0802_001740 [Mischocyttarus mexicanus]|nr:hypothetical protein M0802_001740 [Mischocyttarus mexicanus]